MNYVWFASGHDSDDVPYRLLTLVQMAGVLVLAAGIHDAFVNFDFTTMTIGYVVMRLGLVGMWLRVARDQPDHRRRAMRYVIGITAVQILWLLRLTLPEQTFHRRHQLLGPRRRRAGGADLGRASGTAANSSMPGISPNASGCSRSSSSAR